MKKFLPACINMKNTKYFAYLRFLIIGIILIPVILISFKATLIVEAQPMDLDMTGDGTVSPTHASTTITVSGWVGGDGEVLGDCFYGDCAPLQEVHVYPVTDLSYSIDGGAWVDISSSLTQTVQGEDTSCPCVEYTLYRHSYSRAINISALAQGNHTINVRAQSQSGAIWETGPRPFDNIPFDFQVQPDVNSGSVYQSGTHSVGIRVGRLAGQAGLVNLSVSPASVPANTTITFSPVSCTPSESTNDECVSNMTIQTQASTPANPLPAAPYQIIIIGTHTPTDPDIIHTGNYFLTVNPMPAIMVNVSADPSVGLAPLSNVEIIVNTGGTATGPIQIEIDCAYNGASASFDHIVGSTTSTSYHFIGCNYPAVEDSYMVLARVTRAGNTADATTMVTTTLTALDYCTRRASGGGAQIQAGISESWPTNSIHIYETAGRGPSLRGGFYTMDFSCTACIAEDTTDYRTGIINTFEYRLDNTGMWAPLVRLPIWPDQWGVDSEAGLEGCYIWTGCCLNEAYMYNMYWFDFNLNISPLSVGNHTLNLRAREEWSHEGGYSPNSGEDFPAYDFVNTFYQSIPFAKNGSPGISLVGPENGSYVSSGNPDPTFSATVTDPNVGQPLFAHFEVPSFNPDGIGSTTTTPGTSFWGPIAGIADGTYFWRAYAEDSVGATSSWSEYWTFTKDTIPPYASISYDTGTTLSTNIDITLIESDERTGVASGEVQVRSRIIGNPTWGLWGTSGLPGGGATMSDFSFLGTNGYEYEFQYRATDGAGNVSDWVSPGTVTIASNVSPTATNLSLNNSDFCSASPAYFFSWLYSDGDGDAQSRFDIQVDDSGAGFPSPEINRSYSGLSNPSPTTNNQAVIVLLAAQADYLTYNRPYNWRVRVYDNRVPPNSSGWVNGVPFSFSTPSHRVPVCDFTPPPPPTNLNPGESITFTDTSNCYDASGNIVACVDWDWTFTDGNPAGSTQQIPTTEFSTSGSKNITLIVWDSFGSFCSTTKQVTVSLPLPRWREIRPW